MTTSSIPSILELEELCTMYEKYTVLHQYIRTYGIDRTTYTLAYNDLLRLQTLRLPSLEAYTYSPSNGAFTTSVIVSCEGFIMDILEGIGNFFVKLFTAIFDFFRGLLGGGSGGGGGGDSGKLDSKATKVHNKQQHSRRLIDEVKDQSPEFFVEAGKLCKKQLITDRLLILVWKRVSEAIKKLIPIATSIKQCANSTNMSKGKAAHIRTVLQDVQKLVNNLQKLFGDKSGYTPCSSIIHNADDAERYLDDVSGYVIDLVASKATTGEFQARHDLQHIEEILHEVQDQVEDELKKLQANPQHQGNTQPQQGNIQQQPGNNNTIFISSLKEIGKLILEFFRVTKAAAECLNQALDEIDQSIDAVVTAIKAALKARKQQPGTASIDLRSFYNSLTGASYV